MDHAAIARIARAIATDSPAGGPFVVGVTGSVACGKSTLAAALAPELSRLCGAAVELVASDGFLFPNAILAERGLDLRKGFPETFDLAAMAAALAAARVRPTVIPVHSHFIYDIDPDAARCVGPVEVLLVEGLALGLDRPPSPGETPIIDCLVYIDAEETDLETWFTSRFLDFWRAAENDPNSFYQRFRHLDAEGAVQMAQWVWREINLPNLRQHIAPVRAQADVVVTKGPDHQLTSLLAQDQRWRRRPA